MAFEQRHRDLLQQGTKLFEKRLPLLGLWQEIGDHFYPERSHFTSSPVLGRDFASHLSTSYPIICRRDLGNAFSAMLRPKGKPWFGIRSSYREDDDAARKYLEFASRTQRLAMYDRVSQFVRASKEGDHDFATWGQCVKSVEMNRTRDALLYRCWHLRDVVWTETSDGKTGNVHRKWDPALCDLKALFGADKLSPKLADEKDQYKSINCRHIMVRSEDYAEPLGGKKWKEPYVSVYLDIDNEHMIEEVGVYGKYYVIPRWQTVSGSQYAFSPATVAALPDARLIQAMTLTLLNAGERAASPPMVAQSGVIKSDVDLRADGITWIDREYDERLGEALRPLQFDRTGLQYGLKMREDTRAMLAECFYLNKLGLPPPDREMTAQEASYRVQEYIRQALPLFEPLEDEDNGQVCEETFNLLLRNGAFGPASDIPESLRGSEIQFHFESPLQRAEGSERGALVQAGAAMIAEAAKIDTSVVDIPDAKVALRDALYGIGWPSKWLRSPEESDKIGQQRQQAEAQARATEQAALAAKALESGGKGVKALSEAA